MPEDRSHPDGRLIDVRIARIAASAKRAKPDPVVMLAGGPGQSALEAFPQVAAAFHGVLRDRDVILVDQRGTGQSHPLDCPEADAIEVDDLVEPKVARELAEHCLGELRAGSDPRFYTTSDYVDDLEDVRVALGLDRVNLVGISYGTRVARCSADAVCREKFGSPRARLDALLAKLREHPERVSYLDPLTGERREDTLTATDVAGVVRMYAYAPQLFGMLPMTLAAAATGDYSTLMANTHMIEELIGEQISMALQLSNALSGPEARCPPISTSQCARICRCCCCRGNSIR